MLQAQYLRLQIEALQRDAERAVAEQQRHEVETAHAARKAVVERELGKLVTSLMLLAAYAIILGAVGSPALIATIFDPSTIARNLSRASQAMTALAASVPSTVGTLLGGAFTYLFVLAFQSTSAGLRGDLGGILVSGVGALAVLGFAAAMTSGPFWLLAASCGLVGSAFVLHRFLSMLQRLNALLVDSLPLAPSRGSIRYVADRILDWLTAHARPTSRRWARLAFAGAPVACIGAVAGAAVMFFTSQQVEVHVYWLAWIAMRAFPLWCLWAYTATPKAIRIPLWSMAGWTGLILALLQFNRVSIVFLFGITVILVANVLLFVLRPADDRDQPPAWDASDAGR